MLWYYLEEGIEDFEDLFLYEDRVTGVVWEQLDEAFFQHGHEDVHGSHQRLTLFWFLISVSHAQDTSATRAQSEPHVVLYNKRYKIKIEIPDLLVVFDKLVKAEQDAQPPCTVVWLQVEANFVHDGRPLAGVVMLDHVVDTCRQLDPEEFKRAFFLYWVI